MDVNTNKNTFATTRLHQRCYVNMTAKKQVKNQIII